MAQQQNTSPNLPIQDVLNITHSLMDECIQNSAQLERLFVNNGDLKQEEISLKQENQHLKRQVATWKNLCNMWKNKTYNCEAITKHSTPLVQMRQDRQQALNKLNKKMKEHRKILNQWHLNIAAITIRMNNDGDFDGQDFVNDQKYNGNKANGHLLLESYTNSCKEIKEQQNIAETINDYVISLNQINRSLNDTVNKYKQNEKIQTQYTELSLNHIRVQKKRHSVQQQIETMIAKLNETIKEENALYNKRYKLENSINTLNLERKNYECVLIASNNIKNSYSKFGEKVDNKSDEMQNYYDKKWEQYEKEWTKWNVDDIISWIKYLIYDQKIKLSKHVENSWDEIRQEMIVQEITGNSLEEMDKSELMSIGFKIQNDYRALYKKIKELVQKYPNEYSCDDDENNDDNDEKHIEFPKEFLDPISNELMTDPVIAYDSKTYERKHIVQYLKEHGKAPGDELPPFGDVLSSLIKNRKLKNQIESFRRENKC
eukprot:335283_1